MKARSSSRRPEPRWRRAAGYANEAVLPFYVLHEPVIVAAAWVIVRWEAPIIAKYVALGDRLVRRYSRPVRDAGPTFPRPSFLARDEASDRRSAPGAARQLGSSPERARGLAHLDPAKSQAVMRAMLWMGKIDIDGLRRAYEAFRRSMALWMPALSFSSSRTEHTTVDAAASLIEKETPPERAVAVTAVGRLGVRGGTNAGPLGSSPGMRTKE
jgi:hypothetical protein